MAEYSATRTLTVLRMKEDRSASVKTVGLEMDKLALVSDLFYLSALAIFEYRYDRCHHYKLSGALFSFERIKGKRLRKNPERVAPFGCPFKN